MIIVPGSGVLIQHQPHQLVHSSLIPTPTPSLSPPQRVPNRKPQPQMRPSPLQRDVGHFYRADGGIRRTKRGDPGSGRPWRCVRRRDTTKVMSLFSPFLSFKFPTTTNRPRTTPTLTHHLPPVKTTKRPYLGVGTPHDDAGSPQRHETPRTAVRTPATIRTDKTTAQ